MIEHHGRIPPKGTKDRINDKARNYAFRGAEAFIGTYQVCLYLSTGEEITVTAKSVDVEVMPITITR